jgi:hypothetical protein
MHGSGWEGKVSFDLRVPDSLPFNWMQHVEIQDCVTSHAACCFAYHWQTISTSSSSLMLGLIKLYFELQP